jgi:hypothetical protein
MMRSVASEVVVRALAELPRRIAIEAKDGRRRRSSVVEGRGAGSSRASSEAEGHPEEPEAYSTAV